MRYLIIGALCLITTFMNAQAHLELSDFHKLDDTSWVGTLMYINYSDGKAVQLRTSMDVQLNKNTLQMDTKYLDEPSANGSGTIKIRKDGRYFGIEKVIAKSNVNDSLKFTTRYKGRDNNKPALIFKYYTISNTSFEISKKVIYTDTRDSLIRNKYTYTKQKP
ncbi:hypothetical protein [Muriicola sp. Z0-33]|uniref:hypothetical protein n=1 Tax=Muriicola sp. Z0-33 TaxID=2816957 RepID=UPI00223775EE|nr:hypothetical protein [Muriicola sp. Z0-33]MCW5515363.1 hypothetical protein [Muriicola sp. Z0-33]